MRVSKVDGLSRAKHWVLGAVIAAMCSFVYAKGPGRPNGGGGFAGAHSSGFARAAKRPMRVTGADRMERTEMSRARMPRGGSSHGGDYGSGMGGFRGASGFGVYSPSASSHYPDDGRGRMQYAGAITPVSAESRAVPRPPANAPMRTGSIRADVARYNEERGAARAMQRQSDDPRQPEGSPYRN